MFPGWFHRQNLKDIILDSLFRSLGVSARSSTVAPENIKRRNLLKLSDYFTYSRCGWRLANFVQLLGSAWNKTWFPECGFCEDEFSAFRYLCTCLRHVIGEVCAHHYLQLVFASFFGVKLFRACKRRYRAFMKILCIQVGPGALFRRQHFRFVDTSPYPVGADRFIVELTNLDLPVRKDTLEAVLGYSNKWWWCIAAITPLRLGYFNLHLTFNLNAVGRPVPRSNVRSRRRHLSLDDWELKWL